MSLLAKVHDERFVLCTLKAGVQDTVPLDLFFSEYTEFMVEGTEEVHISGYYTPAGDMNEGDEDDDEDGLLLGEDEEDDDSDEDEDEDEDDDDEYNPGFTFDGDTGVAPDVQYRKRRPDVVIREVTDDEEQQGDAAKARVSSDKAKGNARAALPSTNPQHHAPQPQTPQALSKEDKASQPSKKRKATPVTAASKEEPSKAIEPSMQDALAADTAPASTPKMKKKKKSQEENPSQPATTVQNGGAVHAAKGPATVAAEATASQQKKSVRRWENGFEIEELRLGRPDGKLAKAGKVVTVSYVGRLQSTGKVFDSSKKFNFRLGVGAVIKGWDRGVEGMRVGDKRKLTVPPQMAYGTQGVKGTIPPNAVLEFEVEMLDTR